MIKVAFGMIVFNGDYVLKQTLEQVYPFASQILVAEGPVAYWQEKGFTTSTDQTNNILSSFPDPDNKIKVVHGQWDEKDEQCNAYMSMLNDDVDYLWQIDSDEIYKTEDIEKTIEFLEKETPYSVGVKPVSFFGGFQHYLTGFEQKRDNFLRIFKVTPGSLWATHRPPTIMHTKEELDKLKKSEISYRHINSDEFFERTGVMMYHYSYVFASQVKNKIQYYDAKVAKDKLIPQYFERVWLQWALAGDPSERFFVEQLHGGCHEWKNVYRGHCKSAPFVGTHPESVEKDKEKLEKRFEDELKEYK